MYNLEKSLNVVKGRVYTTEGNPTSDDQMHALMQSPTQQAAEAVLSVLTSAIPFFNVMNSAQVNDGPAAGQFDARFRRHIPPTGPLACARCWPSSSPSGTSAPPTLLVAPSTCGFTGMFRNMRRGTQAPLS
ncbi:uncharacterized protein PG986_012716 [Apiospora aurea]|uniref:Uncharacterized protein n=1 Tax=Apiospora aurea TaxID=335848 RepID=A0ABR1Q0S5_9PEZI